MDANAVNSGLEGVRTALQFVLVLASAVWGAMVLGANIAVMREWRQDSPRMYGNVRFNLLLVIVASLVLVGVMTPMRETASGKAMGVAVSETEAAPMPVETTGGAGLSVDALESPWPAVVLIFGAGCMATSAGLWGALRLGGVRLVRNKAKDAVRKPKRDELGGYVMRLGDDGELVEDSEGIFVRQVL